MVISAISSLGIQGIVAFVVTALAVIAVMSFSAWLAQKASRWSLWKLRPVTLLMLATLSVVTANLAQKAGDRGGTGNEELRMENGEGGGPRSLPPELVAVSNMLVITDFAIDSSNKTVAFEVACSNIIFDYAASRNLYLFSSTNLLDPRWMPLGAFAMPTDTNICAFAVTTNDVEAVALPGFLDTMNGIAFFRFAADVDSDGDGLIDSYEKLWTLTDPELADTDGDWLYDGYEVAVGTDPLWADTDGDGLSDGDEDVMGSNPLLVDTDEDGISDLNEAGSVSVLPVFEWYDTSGFPATYGTHQVGMWGYFGNSATSAFVAPTCINGVGCSSIVAFENGYVALRSPTDFNGWTFPEIPLPLWSHAYNSGTFLVAPYWSPLYLPYGNTSSCLRIGYDVAAAVTVVEFHDVRTGFTSEDGMTFQVIVPSGTGNVVRVSYFASDVWMDGSGAVVGVQDRSHSSSNGYSHLAWNFSSLGPILPGTTVEYRLGTGTNPVSADSDGDGLDDAYELNESGTDPWDSDTDDDGLLDGAEIQTGTDPLSADTDEDGLTDGAEVQGGTSPLSADTDNDGIPDGWEVATGLNPLSDEGVDGASGDFDFDGLTNLQELNLGTAPCDADTDGDNLSDGWEVAHGLNPLSAADGDPDCDGLPNAQEIALGTDPSQPDSDGDGMNDGWEYQHRDAGFNPTVDNATDNDLYNNIDADPDGDGLTNGQECKWGTNPSGLDVNGNGIPDGLDTDGDGVNDGAEIAQNSDPADASDEGKANSRVPVPFCFGDPSDSKSEKYRLTVLPVPGSGIGDAPRSFIWLNENYGECETNKAMAKPGWSYEVRLVHAGSDPDYSGQPKPDYDYKLDCGTGSLPDSVLVDDPDTLFGTDYTSDRFAGKGKVATITLYKVMVEEIKFNHNTGSCTHDAVSIRRSFSEPFDAEHGEWWTGGTELKNDPVCYVGGSDYMPTVKAKISVSPAISSARLFATAVGNNSPLSGLSAQTVTFSGGVSEWTDFSLDAKVARMVRKADHRWEWKVSHVNGAAVTAFVCATTGPHRVYTVLAEPKLPWKPNGLSVKNLWTNALEFCDAFLEGYDDPQETMSAITSHLFYNMGFRYDTDEGMSHYWYSEGLFDFTRYMAHIDSRVNCHDQAFGVATLSSLVGINTRVVAAEPFGYVNTVNLVGVGQCNNPVYGRAEPIVYWKDVMDGQGHTVTTQMTNTVLRTQVCSTDETQRSYFQSHVFVGVLNGLIFDACVGPGLGTLLINDYIRAVIDDSSENERRLSRYWEDATNQLVTHNLNYNLR